jgi:integrase
MILTGYYTGGRLVDLARLRWGNIDLAENTISFNQKKVEGRGSRADVKIPVHPDLEEYLLSAVPGCKRSNVSKAIWQAGNGQKRAFDGL